MVNASAYLRRVALSGLEEARPSGIPVLDSWLQVTEAAERLGLSEFMYLFARPSVTRDNGVNPGHVTWWGVSSGQVTPLGSAELAAREAATAEIARGIDRLRPLLDHPQTGSLFAAWLNIPSLDDDVLLVGGRPVITNWGLLPAQVAASPATRRTHFVSGIGRLLPSRFSLPPFAVEDGTAAIPPSHPPADEIAPAAAPTAANGSPPVAPIPVVSPVIGEVVVQPRRTWLPIAIAAAIAALLLLVLLVPGVLRYPPERIAAQPVDSNVIAEHRQALQRRRELLETMLRDATCVPTTYSPALPPARAPNAVPPNSGGATPPQNQTSTPPPAGQTPAGQTPAGQTPAGQTPAPPVQTQPSQAAPPANQPPSPATQSLIPPSPGRLMGPQTDSGQPSNLITYLDRVTALVVAPKRSGGTAVSFGSGFFINDRQLVTNRHVIEDANPDRIIVVNKVLGRAISGHVTASTQSSEIGGNDFAVIEITAQGTPITLTNTVERGDSVIAAGFPKFVMQNDVGFQRLMEGNLSAIPPPAVSQGWITATQTSDHGLPVLVHGATISQGNSGGPLTDLCGRVVGVNTYGATDTDNALHLNFALRTAGLRQFLDARHVAYTADDAACHPATMPPATAAANPGGTGAIRPGATAPPPAVQTAPILR